jgi:uncharacterized zinc-type alcohol dehydrogenase-like protein
MKVTAWAVRAPKAALERFEYDPGPLADGEVEIAVGHCGICHSDVHLADGDWGKVFPLVPGHEVVGTIVAGGGIAHGTRVGLGWQRGSCGVCEWCSRGEEELCPMHAATCRHNFGGFADRVRAQARFAVPIPESLPSDAVAPLLCGGITVYTPFVRWAGTGARIAVIGIGGLGHLALQFARAMGCEVTAYSRRPDKEADARRFGANEFSTGKPPRKTYDVVLNTAHAAPSFEAFLKALRPRGVFCQVGAVDEPLPVDTSALIGGDRAVAGSQIGPPGRIAEMLAFAATHGIRAQVEVVPMARANEAFERTRRNLARYRMVLANP